MQQGAGHCAVLEAAKQHAAAADCYWEVLVRTPFSAAAACGLARSMRRDASHKVQHDQLREMAARSVVAGGNAARCAAFAANATSFHTSYSGMSQPPPSLASTPSSPRPKQPRSEQPRRRKEAQRLTEEARHVAASGRLDAAIELLRSAVRADHTFGEAYLWWGVCESHMGRDREALQRLAIAEQQLVSEARNSAGDRLQRASTGAFEAGNDLYRLDRKDEALAAYHRALSHNPQSPEALSNLGVLQYTARRYDEAAALFKRAITVAPSFPDAHQHLGAARKALGDAPGALRSYQESARLSPRNSEAFRGVALVLRERGRLPRPSRR